MFGILLILLLALSGFFSGAEVALLSISRVKVRTFVREKRRGAHALQKLKEHPRRMIITILIGNNVANISAASIATVLATRYFGSAGVGIATGVLTALILIFGEITPKSLAARHASFISLKIAPTIWGLSVIFYPLVWVFEHFTQTIEKMFGSGTHDILTEADIKSMVQYGVEEKVVAPHEQFIINKALAFSDQTARSVMIPLKSTFTLAASTPVEHSFQKIIDSGFSRIPIYDTAPERITGLVLIKDVAKELTSDWGHETLGEIATEPIFVADTIRVDYLFRIFQKQHKHMAIVRGADNKAVGIVTLEDLIEELVGDIHDESDVIA